MVEVKRGDLTVASERFVANPGDAELLTALVAAKQALDKATSVHQRAWLAYQQAVSLATAGEALKLVEPVHTAWGKISRNVDGKMVVVIRAGDDLAQRAADAQAAINEGPKRLQTLNEQIAKLTAKRDALVAGDQARQLQLAVERDICRECARLVDWPGLAAIGRDGVRFARDGKEFDTKPLLVGQTTEKIRAPRAPRAPGGGRARVSYSDNGTTYTAEEYARAFGNPDTVAKVEQAIAAGKSASYTHAADAAMSKRIAEGHTVVKS
ncbi:MAG: hypothetical protein ACOY58_08170 [Candidatus Micrarchaeota archaeon]